MKNITQKIIIKITGDNAIIRVLAVKVDLGRTY